MKILIRMTNWIGDCLLAAPAVRGLRQNYPDAEINVLIHKNLISLYENNPNINRVIGFSFSSGIKGFFQRMTLAKELKRESYDKAYILPRSWDSALIPYFAAIPERVGYQNQGRGILLTDVKKRTKKIRQIHQAGYYWNLVHETEVIPKEEMVSEFVLDPAVEDWAKVQIKEKFKNKQVIGIAPGATYGSAKMWLPDRFAALSKQLLQDKDKIVLFFGGKKEAEWINALVEKIPGAQTFAGKTNLQEFAALLKQCDVVLTNDSGPMHIASAVGSPLVVLFGPTNYENTGPLGEHALIHKRTVCSPCMLRHCPIDHRCMKQISVEEVMKAILEKL